MDRAVTELSHLAHYTSHTWVANDAPFGLGLGVIDVKNTDIETPDMVAEHIRKALDVLPAERIQILTDCGCFHLPRDVTFAKMKAMVEGTKIVRKELPAAFPKEVRVYFKDFPLEAVHPWAKDAAITGRCFFRQKPTAFWGYHDWIFENQGQITQENLKEKVSEWAKTAGLESIQLGSCCN